MVAYVTVYLPLFHTGGDVCVWSFQLQDPTTKTTTQVVHQVVSTADKYDMTHLLRPWVNTWCEDLKSHGYRREGWLGERIRIAWIIGNEYMLDDELHAVVLSAYLGDNSAEDDADKDDRVMLGCPDGDENQICNLLNISGMLQTSCSNLVVSH